MKSQPPMMHNSLIAIALLSIMAGMVMFEMLLLVDQLPAWSLLPVFFAVGTLYKYIELLRRQPAATQWQPRVVTVEFDWPLLRKESPYGSYL